MYKQQPLSVLTEREVWIDYAKTITITLVVIGHAYLSENSFLREFIYSFHMPAFFCFSGYLFKKNNISIGTFIRKNIKSLLVPYLIFNLIGCIYYSLIYFFSPNPLYPVVEFLMKSFAEVFLGGVAHMLPCVVTWFLIALFVVRCVCFLLNTKMSILVLPVTTLLAILVSYYKVEKYLFYQLDTVLLAYPFFLLGMFLRIFRNRILQYMCDLKMFTVVLFLVTFVIQMKIYDINGIIDMFYNKYGTNILFYYLISVNGIVMLISFCILFNAFKSFIVEQYSNGTLLILGLHGILLNMIYLFVKHSFNIINPNIIFSLAVSLGIMLLLYYPIVIASKYFPFLLGK